MFDNSPDTGRQQARGGLVQGRRQFTPKTGAHADKRIQSPPFALNNSLCVIASEVYVPLGASTGKKTAGVFCLLKTGCGPKSEVQPIESLSFTPHVFEHVGHPKSRHIPYRIEKVVLFVVSLHCISIKRQERRNIAAKEADFFCTVQFRTQ
jgi:hypothetical protein